MAAWHDVLFVLMVLSTCSTATLFNGDKVITVPEACKGKEFCSVKPPGYDQLEEKMNAALPPFLLQEYGNRIGDSSVKDEPLKEWELSPKSDWHNCPYITKRGPIYLYIHNENHTDMDVIVQTSLFSQNITTVSCGYEYINPAKRHNQECFQDLDLDMDATCNTIYIERYLFVYDRETSKIRRKPYPIPVCCSCQLQQKFNSIW